MVLAAEVCYAIVHPIRHSNVFNKRLIYITISAIWTCSVAYSLGFYVGTSKVIEGSCHVSYGWSSIPVTASIIDDLIKLIIPVLCYGTCYVKIAIFLHVEGKIKPLSQNRNIRQENVSFHNTAKDTGIRQVYLLNDNTEENYIRQINLSSYYQKARKNVAITFFYTVIIHIITSAGSQALKLLTASDYPSDAIPVINQILPLALCANSCINPFIYLIKYERFREAVKRNTRCCKN